MESRYEQLKRSTLKDLLESRGGSASNRRKRELIVELQRLDLTSAMAETPTPSGDETARIVRERLAIYGPNPSEERIAQVFAQVAAEAREQREYELQRIIAQRPPEPAPVSLPPASAGRRKIPYTAFKPFREAEEEIDSYLADFERQCTLHQVPPEEWVTILSGQLSGRAAEAFRAIPEDEVKHYNIVKDTLLKRYTLTPEAYRRKFRDTKKRGCDTHMEWANRLHRTATHWINGCQAVSAEEVLQLFLLEHFFNNLHQDVSHWVRDRYPRTLTEAARLADEYTDSRRLDPAPSLRNGRGNIRDPIVSRPPPRPEVKSSVQSGPLRFFGPSRHSPEYSKVKCHRCHEPGHLVANCPFGPPRPSWNNMPPVSTPTAARDMAVHCVETDPPLEEDLGVLHEVNPIQAASQDNRQQHRQEVKLNGQVVQGLRDTGATITLVRRPLVPANKHTGQTVAVRVAGGAVFRLPTAHVHLDWGAGSGVVKVGLMDTLPAEVLLGNDLGTLTSAYVITPTAEAHPVTTRAQARTERTSSPARETQVRHSPTVTDSQTRIAWDTPEKFGRETRADPSLQKYREKAETGAGGLDNEVFVWETNKLYRVTEQAGQHPYQKRQLVIPSKYRREILRIGHDIPLAGHLGVTRTLHRVTQTFFWPRVHADVRDYCRTCDVCQRVGKRGDHPKAHLVPLPIIEEPFSRVAIDIVGPLTNPSPSGKKYILTVVDYATRYPEAVALSNIRAETVATALIQIFSRVGFPKEILSDRGTQFTAELTQQLWKVCHIKPLLSSPYHPQTNGLCERFNGTLKQMLRTFTSEYRDWERFLPHLLFAYREVPQESTGFSPFELLYGRKVRGPLDLIREHWEGDTEHEGTPIVSYVLELRDRMEQLARTVMDNLQAAQGRQKVWYDRGARRRNFTIGQKVLVLKPDKHDKLQASWQGPYEVIGKICDTTYIIASCKDGRVKRAFHINMLKEYFERPEDVSAVCSPANEEPDNLPLPDLLERGSSTDLLSQVHLGDKLTPTEREQLYNLLQMKSLTFSQDPGYTTLTTHRVETPGQAPLRQPPFRIPEAVKEGMRKEIQEMLRLGVIEPSNSPWASPVVLVPKKDGTTRFCVDYRKLNDRTVTDAYPMPRVEELLDRIARGRYLTTIDLCKGYWQIPLAEEAIPKSAFVTPFGLYQFKVMPFGMKNAPATFQRLVDRLLDGFQDFACAYLDDIAIYSESWEEHLAHIGTVLDQIRAAGLTLKPDKCNFGMAEVQYLGHRVGCGKQRPEPAKIEAVANWPTPRTKTQVLAFLGTAGYYRRFVPDYSTIAKPLTDLTKKNLPRQILWSPECETAFKALKTALVHAPILAAPDPKKRLIVHTDASMFGLGAVLSQVGEDGGEHPVAYLSRKLLPREVSYAAVEKECLALVWALKKLTPYLYGQEFTLVTDHNPLVWLNRVAGDNGRLLRWSLALQPYNFTIQFRPGKQNGNADGLSRQTDLNPV